MLFILLNLSLWVPATFGWGSIMRLFRTFSGEEGEEIGASGLLGIVVLALIASLLNFVIAIDNAVAAILLLTGWILCGVNLRSVRKFKVTDLSLAMAWLLFLSFWASQRPLNPDAGWYHVPAIRWADENPVPLGLANMHPGYGYGSLWFPVASVLKLPFFGLVELSSYSISSLLLFFFGLAVGSAMRHVRKETRLALHDLFLSLTPLLLLGGQIRKNISSPSPDLPVLILALISIFLALRFLFSHRRSSLFLITVFCCFAVAVKSSAFPLLLLPASLSIFEALHQTSPSFKKCLIKSVAFGGSILVVWMIRSLILSGCAVFPVLQTCIWTLDWSVPSSNAEYWNVVVQQQARLKILNADPYAVLSNWNWITPWFRGMVSSLDFLLPVAMVFWSVVIFRIGNHFPKRIGWIVAPIVAALLFWFFTAPDIRYGAYAFWSLAFLFVAATMQALSMAGSHYRFAALGMLLALILAISFHLRVWLNFGLPPVRKMLRDPRSFFLRIPLPEMDLRVDRNHQGILFYISNKGSECWFSDIPCARGINNNIEVVQSPNGEFKKFRYK